jgi:hypothetical protein
MTQIVITANRAREGCVVYLAGPGIWSKNLSDALVIEGKDAADALLSGALRDAAADAIIGPYGFPVSVNNDGITVLSQREKIRIHGPSIQIPSAREKQHVPL